VLPCAAELTCPCACNTKVPAANPSAGSSDGKTGKAVEFEQLMPSFLYNLAE